VVIPISNQQTTPPPISFIHIVLLFSQPRHLTTVLLSRDRPPILHCLFTSNIFVTHTLITTTPYPLFQIQWIPNPLQSDLLVNLPPPKDIPVSSLFTSVPTLCPPHKEIQPPLQSRRRNPLQNAGAAPQGGLAHSMRRSLQSFAEKSY
jgi:hypothetical protein